MQLPWLTLMFMNNNRRVVGLLLVLAAVAAGMPPLVADAMALLAGLVLIAAVMLPAYGMKREMHAGRG